MTRAVIVAARRSPVAPRRLDLAAYEPHLLAAPVIQACLSDCGIDPMRVDELIMGNALGAGGNPARVAALAAGLPERVAGMTLDRQCCGGLDALLVAQAMIMAGQADIVVAGGAESFSRRPIRMWPGRDGANAEPFDQAPFTPWPDRDPDMAEAADALARSGGLSRERQDAWAMQSHTKALAARSRLSHEIVPIGVAKSDSYTRRMTTALCARAPTITGSITKANTAVAADGAAFCIVVAEPVARRLDTPKVEVLGGRTIGGDPTLPGRAPITAIVEALGGLALRPCDLSFAEIMEAYAVQAIVCVEESGLDPAIVNGSGGALARGHPVGASGAILAVRLFHDLSGSRGQGLAAIAAAGGIGTAVVLADRTRD